MDSNQGDCKTRNETKQAERKGNETQQKRNMIKQTRNDKNHQ